MQFEQLACHDIYLHYKCVSHLICLIQIIFNKWPYFEGVITVFRTSIVDNTDATHLICRFWHLEIAQTDGTRVIILNIRFVTLRTYRDTRFIHLTFALSISYIGRKVSIISNTNSISVHFLMTCLLRLTLTINNKIIGTFLLN